MPIEPTAREALWSVRRGTYGQFVRTDDGLLLSARGHPMSTEGRIVGHPEATLTAEGRHLVPAA